MHWVLVNITMESGAAAICVAYLIGEFISENPAAINL